MIQNSFSGTAAIWPSAVIVWSHCTKQQQTIDQQGQTGLSARLSGAFCSFRLGLRQPRSKGTSLGSIGENMPTQPACISKAKNHSKIHRWQVHSSFVGAEMCPDKKRPAGNTCRIAKGFDAVWAHFCPSKPCLPLSIDGMEQYSTLPAEFHPCLRNCALRRPNIHIPRINIYQRCI